MGSKNKKIVLTKEQIESISKLAPMLSVEQICRYLGIDKATFYRIRQRQPEVMIAYEDSRARMAVRVASSLYQQAISGNVVAARFILATQFGWTEQRFEKISSYAEVADEEISAALHPRLTAKKAKATSESVAKSLDDITQAMMRKIEACG